MSDDQKETRWGRGSSTNDEIKTAISNVDYRDTPSGKIFYNTMSNYIEFKKSHHTYEKSTLSVIYKKIYKESAQDKVTLDCMPHITPAPEYADVLTRLYMVQTIENLYVCRMSTLKIDILEQLAQYGHVLKLILELHLNSTHTGKSDRGWGKKKIDYIIATNQIKTSTLLPLLVESFKLGVNGTLIIADTQSLDMLGTILIINHTQHRIETQYKIENKSLYRDVNDFEDDVQKGVDSFIESDTENYKNIPDVSITGVTCITGCESRKWPGREDKGVECACPVVKRGWFGTYKEVEPCHSVKCKRSLS
jgi:hypothetical protein